MTGMPVSSKRKEMLTLIGDIPIPVALELSSSHAASRIAMSPTKGKPTRQLMEISRGYYTCVSQIF